MKKLKLLLLCVFALLNTAVAQKLSVESFVLAQTDITAQTEGRKDLNGDACALVKISFVGDVLDVEGNVIKPLVKRNNETWAFMTQGSREIKVVTKNYLPLLIKFGDYGIGKLVKNSTYVLTVVKKNLAKDVISTHGSTSTFGNTDNVSQSTDSSMTTMLVKSVMNYTADEIVDKYKAQMPVAYGDGKSLQQQTVVNSSILDKEGKNHNASTFICYDLLQKKYLKITSCSDKKYRSAVMLDGEKGWLLIKGGKIKLGRKNVKTLFDAMSKNEETNCFNDRSWKRTNAGIQSYNGKKYFKIVFTKSTEKSIYVALFDTETFLLSYLDNGTTIIEYLKYEKIDGNFVCSERKITNGDKLASKTKVKSSKETLIRYMTDANVDDNLLNPDIVQDILKGKVPQPW